MPPKDNDENGHHKDETTQETIQSRPYRPIRQDDGVGIMTGGRKRKDDRILDMREKLADAEKERIEGLRRLKKRDDKSRQRLGEEKRDRPYREHRRSR